MQRRNIGGFDVAPLGLGTGRLASLGAGTSKRDAERLLDTAADLGINVVDTADTYGSTACERWLGELMQGRASRFVIATKSGLPTADLPRPLRPLNQPAKKVLQRFGPAHRLEPKQLRRSIDASLGRLGRERLELYFLHLPPAGVEQRDDVFAVLDEARRAGKIGHYGISSTDTASIGAAARVRGCRIAQTMVNPLTSDAVRALDGDAPVELIANHVLMGPMLMSPSTPQDALPAIVELARKVDAIRAERGVSRSSLLLRHAAAVAGVRVVLVGTSDPAHLAENAAALEQPPHTADLLA